MMMTEYSKCSIEAIRAAIKFSFGMTVYGSAVMVPIQVKDSNLGLIYYRTEKVHIQIIKLYQTKLMKVLYA
jgi:hypothetical protein